MTKGLRCPTCGAIPSFLCIDVNDVTHYQCKMGATTFGKDGGRNSYIVPCDTVITAGGKVVTGHITIFKEGKDTVSSKQYPFGKMTDIEV